MAKEEKKVVKEKKTQKEKKQFFKNFKSELKKVVWPTPKQLVNNTIAVVTIVIATVIIVFLLDLAFMALNTHGIEAIKKTVESNNVEVVQDENIITTEDTLETEQTEDQAVEQNQEQVAQ